ncbi:MAG: CAP domain-containing protein [Polyangiaceae bacterium]|nr:CAP domain-containing protein [Polyangiaceae bacterium]
MPARVAALRAHQAVSALRPNRLLDAEARAHAQDVCREGRAAHRLRDGDPEERLARRGITARVVGETVARARTVARALAALAESPSHRLTLVDRRFTDGGYGVASDRSGGRCVVVLLAAWPRPLGR